MNTFIKNINWRKHTVGLVWLAAALILLSLATIAYFRQKEILQKTQQSYSAQLNVNQNASAAQDELNTNLAEYQRWQTQGLIGDPERLAWLETLKLLGEQYKIPRIEFELQSSALASITDTSYWHEEIAITLTPMTLKLGLTHEEDWSNLFTALRQEAKGLFDLNHCELTHFPRELRLAPEVSLTAVCELTWYSLADVTRHWPEQTAK